MSSYFTAFIYNRNFVNKRNTTEQIAQVNKRPKFNFSLTN